MKARGSPFPQNDRQIPGFQRASSVGEVAALILYTMPRNWNQARRKVDSYPKKDHKPIRFGVCIRSCMHSSWPWLRKMRLIGAARTSKEITRSTAYFIVHTFDLMVVVAFL